MINMFLVASIILNISMIVLLVILCKSKSTRIMDDIMGDIQYIIISCVNMEIETRDKKMSSEELIKRSTVRAFDTINKKLTRELRSYITDDSIKYFITRSTYIICMEILKKELD